MSCKNGLGGCACLCECPAETPCSNCGGCTPNTYFVFLPSHECPRDNFCLTYSGKIDGVCKWYFQDSPHFEATLTLSATTWTLEIKYDGSDCFSATADITSEGCPKSFTIGTAEITACHCPSGCAGCSSCPEDYKAGDTSSMCAKNLDLKVDLAPLSTCGCSAFDLTAGTLVNLTNTSGLACCNFYAILVLEDAMTVEVFLDWFEGCWTLKVQSGSDTACPDRPVWFLGTINSHGPCGVYVDNQGLSCNPLQGLEVYGTTCSADAGCNDCTPVLALHYDVGSTTVEYCNDACTWRDFTLGTTLQWAPTGSRSGQWTATTSAGSFLGGTDPCDPTGIYTGDAGTVEVA